MTYRDLIKLIINSEFQLDRNVTLYSKSNGEFYPALHCDFAKTDNDVLDFNHLYIVLE